MVVNGTCFAFDSTVRTAVRVSCVEYDISSRALGFRSLLSIYYHLARAHGTVVQCGSKVPRIFFFGPYLTFSLSLIVIFPLIGLI